MYKSPIELIISEMQTKLVEEKERRILKGVQNIGINVDKDELVKALAYDRNQYKKGYADRDDEIVRCKDCRHSRIEGDVTLFMWCGYWNKPTDGNRYCSDGERREP